MSEEFGAVRPDNTTRRPRTSRRDPDAETVTPDPTPPAAPQPPEPEAVRPVPTQPGPHDPLPQPPGPPQPTGPSRHAGAAVAARNGADTGTLASVLTAPQTSTPGVNGNVAALAALAGMANRPKDPMQDWTGDGTRVLRWVGIAIRQYAMLTGRKTQEITANAILGTDPIPGDVLDAAWLTCYGYPRENYDPEAYR
jgi:hypothetical protein